MSETTTISLGGRDFTIEPLKLGQLRALLDALDDLSGKTGGAVIDAAARVIQAGLARGMPDITLARVLELEATMDEVTAAVGVILRAAGLRHPEDAGLGEAGLGQASSGQASSGQASSGEVVPGEARPVAKARRARGPAPA